MKLLFILILISSSISCFSQTLNRREQRIYNRYISFKQIDSLKNGGVILHKLQTSSNKIAALKKSNNEKLATDAYIDQRNINKTIMNDYKSNFSFCPVYFFYSDSITNIIHGKISGNLLDHNLRVDTSIKPIIERFYIAQFSNLEFIYTAHKDLPSDYYTNPTTVSAIYCINLSDKNQVYSLKKPFPYYTTSIINLNNALFKFYAKSKKPLTKRKQNNLDKVLRKLNLI